ncbi:NYN domain-containing protein [Myxococcus xanthus]|uniref:NYN domain-containing protein n=1 Tax=Myxococcus xanthus TaxID=34 RepID=UPI0011264C1B|nr:NYN domain-containing protein [Myxococcus xanthus]
MRFNVYVDGSWLFKQCGPEKLLANRMEFPTQSFRLDFQKLLGLLGKELSERIGDKDKIDGPGDLFFYTALFVMPDEVDPEWPDISVIRRGVEARERFISEAKQAGFQDSGIFHVPLRRWMVDKLNERRYQEKMVDTSLVARLVERTINAPDTIHVVVSGDLDMLPGIKTVVPDYSRRVVLLTTHPDQYDRSEAQSSFRLSQFDFEIEPIYIERHVGEIVRGTYPYRCSNKTCGCVFVRERKIPKASNPVCKPCHDRRGAS